MTRAEEMIRWIIGTDFKECYVVLSQAIDVAYGALPEKLSIGDIGRQVHIQTGKGKTAVSKALSRAAAEIWDHGDQAVLAEIFGKQMERCEKPLPRDLVFALAYFMERRLVRYQVWRDRYDGKEGIVAVDPVTGRWLESVSFHPENQQIDQFVHLSNQDHIPLEHFRDFFAGSELMEPFERM